VSEPPVFKRLTLIGLGLIGSSVARAARETGAVGEIIACDANEAVCARVAELGLADVMEPDARLAVAGADCVMLCAPVGAMAEIAAAIAPFLAQGAVLTDVGSTKISVLRDVGPLVPAGVHFVPGHPLAGTEFSGPDAGFAALFEGRWTLVVPPAGTDPVAVERVSALWRRFGAMVEVMEPAHHDRVLAMVSHLPHLLAFTICGTADDPAGGTALRRLRLSGFHPHRGFGPDHVARHLPQQPRGAAGDAGAVHGGCAGDGAGDPLGRRGLYRGPRDARPEDQAQPDRSEAGLNEMSRVRRDLP
jgi:cyclohexadieny/prephenate dehydrogenase